MNYPINRRRFLKQSAVAAGAAAAGALSTRAADAILNPPAASAPARGVSILANPADPIVSSKPAQWAIEQLRLALAAKNIPVRVCARRSEVNPADFCVIAEPMAPAEGAGKSEMVSFQPSVDRGQAFLSAAGSDARGLAYALTELADIAASEAEPVAALTRVTGSVEQPANAVRGVMRMFVSEVEDKAWFNDREFWRGYLTLLAAQRFNRFNLSLGLGYDSPSGIADSYFYFAYPFLISVPGYTVKATNLPDAERDQNLEMLRFISDECAARGLHFQLGIWTHAYDFGRSPNVNHTIEGLTPDTQAAYCKQALALLLRECPNINGVTFRIHGESGVAEGNPEFWKTVFEGCVGAGRPMQIDLHAKGIDEGTIDAALSTKLPFTISPKYWAEHLGLPYHQAMIRSTEMVVPGRRGNGLQTVSSGSRSFTRYGYADLLTERRPYGIIHRVWPGTQRVLLWGDPTFAAAYGKAMSFCGSLGCEIMEPLSYKGRKGSGLPGGRDGYADTTLRAAGGDFEKYRYTYRLWGRLLYNPEAKPEVWRRYLRMEYGPAAPSVETSLANASRILPLFTTAHLPAAANANYWVEMCVNMSIVNETSGTYGGNETPAPRRFGTVNPLDPQLFSRVEDHVDDLIRGNSNGKYSPAEVAQWLDQLASSAAEQLEQAKKAAADPKSPAFRRFAIDTGAQLGLGRFFAHKFRAAMLFAIYDRSGDRPAMDQAIASYRLARAEWAHLVELTQGAYAADVTYGNSAFQRGHWSERLAAIDRDIATLEQRATAAPPANASVTPEQAAVLIRTIQAAPPARPRFDIDHATPPPLKPGTPVPLQVAARNLAPKSVTAYYRHVNHGESWRSVPMTLASGQFSATIPADYATSEFPLQYYFELRDEAGGAALHPGLGARWIQQPYFVLRAAAPA